MKRLRSFFEDPLPTCFTMVVLLLAAGCAAPGAPAVTSGPFAGPGPIAVWIEVNPWLMVVGSDTPMLALHENGDLIYVTKAEGQEHYYRAHRQLDQDELIALKSKLSSYYRFGRYKDSVFCWTGIKYD